MPQLNPGKDGPESAHLSASPQRSSRQPSKDTNKSQPARQGPQNDSQTPNQALRDGTSQQPKNKNVAYSLIRSVCSRILHVLPARSGFTLSRLEVDPNFSSGRKHLVGLASRGYAEEIFRVLYEMLVTITVGSATGASTNSTLTSHSGSTLSSHSGSTSSRSSASVGATGSATAGPTAGTTAGPAAPGPMSVPSLHINPEDLSVATLRSVVIVLDMLTEVCIEVWGPEVAKIPENASIYTGLGLKAPASRFNSDIYATAPAPAFKDSKLVLDYLNMLSQIKNNNELFVELEAVQDGSYPTAIPQDTSMLVHSASDRESSPDDCEVCGTESKSTLNSAVGRRINCLCSFFATSNPREYFRFLEIRLKSAKTLNTEQPFLPLTDWLGLVTLSGDNVVDYMSLIRSTLHFARRSSQQALLASFFSRAVWTWVFFRTADFLAIQKRPAVQEAATALFEFASRTMESKFYRKSLIKIQTACIMFLPSAFAKYNETHPAPSSRTGSTLKRPTVFKSVSNKQKFIQDISRIISKYAEASMSLTLLLRAGCVMSFFETHNPVVEYGRRIWKSVYNEVFGTSSGLSLGSVSSRLGGSASHTSPTPPTATSSGIPGASQVDIPDRLLVQLRTDMFAVALVICSEESFQRAANVCNRTVFNLSDVMNVFGGLMQISKQPTLAHHVYPYLQKVNPVLLKTITSLCLDIEEDERCHNSTLHPPSHSPGGCAAAGGTAEYATSPPSDPSSDTIGQQLDESEESFNSSSSKTGPAETTKRIARKMTGWAVPPSSSSNSTPTGSSTSASTTGAGSIGASSFAGPSASTFSSTSALGKESYVVSERAIVACALHVYKVYPHLYYQMLTDTSRIPRYSEYAGKFTEYVNPIVSVVVDSDRELAEAVESMIFAFALTIGNTNPTAAAIAFTSSVLNLAYLAAISLRVDVSRGQREHVIKLMSRCSELMELYSDDDQLVAVYRTPQALSVHSPGDAKEPLHILEKSLFAGICSDNIDTVRVSRVMLKRYVTGISLFHDTTCYDEATVQLIDKILSDKAQTGNLALRKKLRDHLAAIPCPSETLIDIWEYMYGQLAVAHPYEAMNKAHAAGKVFNVDEYQEMDVEDYGEYVCSLGGIFFAPEFREDPRRPEFIQKINTFLSYTAECLFSKDMKKRERSRDILCVCIHPYLSGTLLKLVDHHLDRFEKALKQKQYDLCGLFINIMRAICQVDGCALFYQVAEIGLINAKMLKMLDFVEPSAEFLRLKLKFCKLQVLFCSREQELAMHGDIYDGNDYVRVISHYLEDSFEYDHSDDASSQKFVGSAKGQSQSSVSLQFQRQELRDLHLNIKVETSEVLKIVFYDLPLDTPNHDLTSSKEDRLAAGVVFSNYFSLFVRILERLNRDSRESANMASRHRRESIVRNIIQALVNLLSSNSDVGLRYSLPLGYHSDTLIRVSFINVFSRIIENVYKPRKGANKELLLELAKLLYSGNPALLVAAVDACPRSEVDAFANSLLQITDNRYKQMQTLQCLITADILGVNDSVEILRSNTIATRLVALYSHTYGEEYIRCALQAPIQELADSKVYFEIEKTKNMDDSEKTTNLDRFMKFLGDIVDCICESIPNMPLGIRVISKAIFDATAQKFPQSKFTALGAYLFLRLYNPAIVSPDRNGLVTCNDQLFKRSLIQIARTLQMIVNDGKPELRFPLLQSKKSELDIIAKRIDKFMLDVIDIDPEIMEVGSKLAGDVQFNYNAGIIFFHSYFYDHWCAIRARYSHPMVFYDDTYSNKARIIRQVDDTLCSLGLPVRIKGYEIPDSIKNDKSDKGILLYDFMSKVSLKDVDAGGSMNVLITRDGMPLMTVKLRDIPPKLSREMIVYMWIQTLSKYWHEPYCYLLDATGYDKDVNFGPAMELFHSLLPTNYRSNCKRVYFFNVSTKFVRLLQDYEYTTENCGVPPNTQFFFPTSGDDPKSFSEIGLLGFIPPVVYDARVVFSDVSLYQPENKRFVPVKIKVGNECMQVFSTQQQEVKAGTTIQHVCTADFYDILNLDEIAATNYTGVPNELSMTDSATNTKLIFASPKKIEIMRTIYFSRARASKEPPVPRGASGHGDNEEIELKNSVGQLLNVALSGLLHKSGDVRNASFTLLTSMVDLFSFKLSRKLDSVDGVTFPYGEIGYVRSISQELAENHSKLTYPILKGFFAAYYDAPPENRTSMLMYISPWIRNLFRWVYQDDPISGPSRTGDLIRRLVKASRDSEDSQGFLMFVWDQLSLEDQLVEIIVDEIVAAAIDHEAEGHDWVEITRYWPLTPTIEICSFLLRRLREKSYAMTFNESDIEAHTYWVETIVLMRLLSSLVFDSLLFVEKFLSEIFYVVTICMQRGPYHLRKCMSNLLIRTFHSFLGREGLTLEQREKIRSYIETLNGARYRMLFGLTRESDVDAMIKTPAEAVNKSNAVSTLCDLLIEFLKEFSTPEDCELRLIQWSSFLLNIAFDRKSGLQSEAILVLGSLAKEGVNTILVSKFLSCLIEVGTRTASSIDMMLSDTPFVICDFHAFGRAMQGIDPDSEYIPRIFWLAYMLLFLDSPLMFKFGLMYIQTLSKKITEHIKNSPEEDDYSEYLSKYRADFCPLLEEFESIFNIKYSKEHFDEILCTVIVKGFFVPYCYNASWDTTKLLLSVRYAEVKEVEKRTGKVQSGDPKYGIYMWYVFLLSSSNADLAESLKDCAIEDISMTRIPGGVDMPSVFSTWYNVYSTFAMLCVLGSLNFLSQSNVNEVVCLRAVKLYHFHQLQRPLIAFGMWDQISKVLQSYIEKSSTTYLFDACLDCMTAALELTDTDDSQKYQMQGWKTLVDANLSGLKDLKFTRKDPFDIPSDDTYTFIAQCYKYLRTLAEYLRNVSLEEE